MAKKAKFEIYEGFTKRKKKYIVIPKAVSNGTYEAAFHYVMRLNHCSSDHIFMQSGYILNGLLYIGYSENKKAKPVYIYSYVK